MPSWACIGVPSRPDKFNFTGLRSVHLTWSIYKQYKDGVLGGMYFSGCCHIGACELWYLTLNEYSYFLHDQVHDSYRGNRSTFYLFLLLVCLRNEGLPL